MYLAFGVLPHKQKASVVEQIEQLTAVNLVKGNPNTQGGQLFQKSKDIRCS